MALDDPEPEDHQKDYEDMEEDEYDLTFLINQAMYHVEPGDIHHVLSLPPTAKKDKCKTKCNDLHVVTLHETIYNVSASRRSIQQSSSLIDQGANGRIAGDNIRIIATTDRSVNVSGIDNHQLTDLKIVTASGVCPSNQGEVVVILHQS